MGRTLDMAIGALNGAVGDYLARTGNGLATDTECFAHGAPLPLTEGAIRAVHPKPSARVVVLVHGLMCTEAVWSFDDGGDYGSLLQTELDFTPYYVRYNSGLPIPDSGASLSAMMQRLVDAHPVAIEELVLIGFSMGGLVVRAACHAASSPRDVDGARGSGWLSKVTRAIYVGTPHLGAPLERLGRAFTRLMHAIPDPYTRLIAQLGDLRSDGLKDLGDADVRHEDRARRRPHVSLRDPKHPVPMLPSIRHYLVAGSLSKDPIVSAFFGDALVPVPSGTDGLCVDRLGMLLPPSHVKLITGVAHITLAHHRDVYAQIKEWVQ